jgi:hypothetical protein
MSTTIEAGVEAGSKRVFVSAFEWPGWCRSAADEETAVETLFGYRSRYRAALRGAGVAFTAPARVSAIRVVERVQGNATTDFGAPDGEFDDDDRPIDRRGLTRFLKVLDACWGAFDASVEAARGVELRTGPRGGGRDLGSIVDHVVQAEASYCRKLAARVSLGDDDPWAARIEERDQIREAITVAVLEGMPAAGPRGGKLWAPRRFLRRAAWHVLDHAWEIEDRADPPGS